MEVIFFYLCLTRRLDCNRFASTSIVKWHSLNRIWVCLNYFTQCFSCWQSREAEAIRATVYLLSNTDWRVTRLQSNWTILNQPMTIGRLDSSSLKRTDEPSVRLIASMDISIQRQCVLNSPPPGRQVSACYYRNSDTVNSIRVIKVLHPSVYRFLRSRWTVWATSNCQFVF